MATHRGGSNDGNASVAQDGQPASEAPGPDGLPLVGNTLSFLRDPVGFYDDARTYESDVVQFDIAGTNGFILKHPDYIQDILVDQHDRFIKGQLTQDSLGQVLDGGVLLEEGDTWARQRKLLQPVFYRERIETYAETMSATAREIAGEWTLRAGSTDAVIQTRDEMQHLTLSVLARTLFGVDLDARGSAIRSAARALLARFDTRKPSAYLPNWVPTPTNRRFRDARAELFALIDELVAERRAADAPGDDLLSLLVDAGDEDDALDGSDIRSNMLTFLVAGF